MDFSWLVTAILHLLPMIMVIVTWRLEWPVALEKTVRVQVIATIVYFVIYPVVGMLGWPEFQLSDINLGNLSSYWHDDGIWNAFKVISAVAVTAIVLFVRRRIKK